MGHTIQHTRRLIHIQGKEYLRQSNEKTKSYTRQKTPKWIAKFIIKQITTGKRQSHEQKNSPDGRKIYERQVTAQEKTRNGQDK